MAYGFIYITQNIINNKKYIGQKRYDKRGVWRKYLGSGIQLTRAVKKYGKENFRRIIIDEADDLSELNKKEAYWIDYYNAANDSEYYNIALGGNQNNLEGYTPEDRERLLAKQKKAVSESAKRMCGELSKTNKLTTNEVKTIIQRLLSGECRSVIARDYNVSPQTILDIALHRTWKHLTDGISFPKPSHDAIHNSVIKQIGRVVDAYDLQNNYIGTFPSMHDAARALGISYKHISDVCNGKRKYTEGYIFRYNTN